MLETLRDARKLYLEMYHDPDDPVLGDLAVVETKLILRIERDARRVS
jgi:hypothetical protein